LTIRSNQLEPWIAGALPLVLAGSGLAVVSVGDLDFRIVQRFFDASSGSWPYQWNFWTQTVFHKGGRDGVVAVAVAAAGVAALAGRCRAVSGHWRWPACYFVLALGLCTGLVAVLKSMSWVPCPWESTVFGGDVVHGSLWVFSPGGIRHGRCYPGAHASSGFALMASYYALRVRHRRAAWLALAGGGAGGFLFGAAQTARGAHYPSHNLWSAIMVWSVCTLLYWGCPSGRLWRRGPTLR